MKKLFKIFSAMILAVQFFVGNVFITAYAYEDYLYLSGEVYGFSLVSEGLSVIGLSEVVTENGVYSPAKESGVKIGDIITKINGNPLNSDEDTDKFLIDGYNDLEILRDGKRVYLSVKPAKELNGNLRLGVFIRSDFNGIGTVSYYDKDGNFAALGHEIRDENFKKTTVTGGTLKSAKITEIVKGYKGIAGELRGFLKNDEVGKIAYGTDTGIYGKKSDFDESGKIKIPVGSAEKTEIGNASIFTDVSGSLEEYRVKIIKVNANKNEKNFVIKISDEKLIEITGGIVQGMSGTPIVQDGKLIGILTHVFINDSKLGYGLSIEKSLSNFKQR